MISEEKLKALAAMMYGTIEDRIIHDLARELLAMQEDAKSMAIWIKLSNLDKLRLRKDHACAQCVPDGDMVTFGFVCGRHVAERIIARFTPSDSSESAVEHVMSCEMTVQDDAAFEPPPEVFVVMDTSGTNLKVAYVTRLEAESGLYPDDKIAGPYRLAPKADASDEERETCQHCLGKGWTAKGAYDALLNAVRKLARAESSLAARHAPVVCPVCGVDLTRVPHQLPCLNVAALLSPLADIIVAVENDDTAKAGELLMALPTLITAREQAAEAKGRAAGLEDVIKLVEQHVEAEPKTVYMSEIRSRIRSSSRQSLEELLGAIRALAKP